MLPATDKEGFLKKLDDWNHEVALELAALDGVTLTEEHWEIINIARCYYQQHNIFPVNRVLVKRMKEELGTDKGTSIHLMKLFTGKPAKLIARIAGLPKPTNCD